jgi:hypothetical protein
MTDLVEIAWETLAAPKDSEERLRTLCERAPAMIDAFDDHGNVTL